MKQSQNDPVIDEIREIRHRISAQFDHDPARLVAYYMEQQKKYQDRLMTTGQGNYTEERDTLFDNMTLDEIVDETKKMRKSPDSD